MDPETLKFKRQQQKVINVNLHDFEIKLSLTFKQKLNITLILHYNYTRKTPTMFRSERKILTHVDI